MSHRHHSSRSHSGEKRSSSRGSARSSPKSSEKPVEEETGLVDPITPSKSPLRMLLAPLGPFGGLTIVKEYERGVLFRMGRVVGISGPGPFLLIPKMEKLVKVDLRTVVADVDHQQAVTKDNVSVKVNAVIYYRVVNPRDAILKVVSVNTATSQIAQTTLRSVLGECDLDELLSSRDKINHRLQQIIDEQTDPWGVKVSHVEVKDVELPSSLQRSMSKQAEAERQRRAKVIDAEGEFQASQRLAQAGAVMAAQPATMQLRFLQTLQDIAGEKNSTIVFPLPVELLKAFSSVRGGGGEAPMVTIPEITPDPGLAADLMTDFTKKRVKTSEKMKKGKESSDSGSESTDDDDDEIMA